jgi:hypothetical protein
MPPEVLRQLGLYLDCRTKVPSIPFEAKTLIGTGQNRWRKDVSRAAEPNGIYWQSRMPPGVVMAWMVLLVLCYSGG